MRRFVVLSWMVLLAACRSGQSNGGTNLVVDSGADAVAEAPADEAAAAPFPVLLFSRTVGFRHDSIPAAIQALTELQDDRRLHGRGDRGSDRVHRRQPGALSASWSSC